MSSVFHLRPREVTRSRTMTSSETLTSVTPSYLAAVQSVVKVPGDLLCTLISCLIANGRASVYQGFDLVHRRLLAPAQETWGTQSCLCRLQGKEAVDTRSIFAWCNDNAFFMVGSAFTKTRRKLPFQERVVILGNSLTLLGSYTVCFLSSFPPFLHSTFNHT